MYTISVAWAGPRPCPAWAGAAGEGTGCTEGGVATPARAGHGPAWAGHGLGLANAKDVLHICMQIHIYIYTEIYIYIYIYIYMYTYLISSEMI